MSLNFISSKDSDETRNMHTKNDNVEITMGSERNDIIEESLWISFGKILGWIRRINEKKWVYFW